jgi:hypothetical protein
MKVLSFDVGIKNLGACIIEYNDDPINIKSKLQIHYWDIINVVNSKSEDEQISYKCIDGNCTNKPKSYIEFNDIKYCMCSKHLQKKDELLNDIFSVWDESKWIQVKNCVCMKCQNEEKIEIPSLVVGLHPQPAYGITSNTSSGTSVPSSVLAEDVLENNIKLDQISKSKNSISRKAYFSNNELNFILCNKHYKNLINKSTVAQKKIYPIKNKKVKDMTSNDLKLQLVKCLDKRKEQLLTIADIVLIENQPTFKNPTMKAISDTIYTWFMVRGIVDSQLNNSSIKEVKFISPSNKLKEFDTSKIDEADESKKYKITKKLSVENTKTILASYELNNWLTKLLSFDKKDDLADSFLQGWYILNNLNSDKLYSEWKILYNNMIINTDDTIDNIKTSKIKKSTKKKSNVLDLRQDRD